jgi:hypothetical protein
MDRKRRKGQRLTDKRRHTHTHTERETERERERDRERERVHLLYVPRAMSKEHCHDLEIRDVCNIQTRNRNVQDKRGSISTCLAHHHCHHHRPSQQSAAAWLG